MLDLFACWFNPSTQNEELRLLSLFKLLFPSYPVKLIAALPSNLTTSICEVMAGSQLTACVN